MKSKLPSFFISGTMLAGAVMGANVINLLFNIYIGRSISTEDFGVLTLINTLLFFLNLFYFSLGSVTNREVAFLDSKVSGAASTNFFTSISKQVLWTSLMIGVLWFLAVPFTTSFFNLSTSSILYSFTPLFLLYPLAFLGRGYLQGKLLFALCAVSVLIEPLIKFISAFFLLESNLHSSVYLSIYISAALTGIITYFLVRKSFNKEGEKTKYSFPKALFTAGLLSGASTISFLSLDMILVKHFMTPTEAGEYAFLSLLGKIVYFLGALLNIFTITLVTRSKNKNNFASFYLLFFASSLLAFSGVFVFGVFGAISIPLIFGQKAVSIISYALPYLTAIALFTLGNIIVTYHLARKEYLFPYISVFFAIVLTIGISLYHQTLTQIVYVLITVGFVYSLSVALIHILQNFFTPKVAIKSLQQTQESLIT